MESIISNIHDPSWWFTGLFFVFLVFVFKISSQHLPKFLVGLFKYRKLKRLSRYRELRHSQASITYSIVKAHSYFVIFVAICCMYVVWFTSSSMVLLIKTNPLAGVILTSPIYIAEMLWLFKDQFAEDLIKEYNKTLKYARKSRGPDAITHTV